MPLELLSRETALRIGLAARALPDATPSAVLDMLDALVGLPPSEDQLRSLRIRDLRTFFDTASKNDLALALAYLKGEAGDEAVPPPALEKPLADPHSILVACASNSGEALDGHFGSCQRFLVYQINAVETRLVDIRPVDFEVGGSEGSDARAELIADCKVLFIASIGGPAAAKVVKRGIHPVRVTDGGNARDIVVSLSARLGTNPAPWIARAMGREPADATL